MFIIFIFQLLDYSNLRVTGQLQPRNANEPGGSRLWGLVTVGDRHLVTVQSSFDDLEYTSRPVCLYEVTARGRADTLTLLDSDLELRYAQSPRADRHGQIYVLHEAGVAVLQIVDNRHLYKDRILTGHGRLWDAWGVAVLNDTTLCVTVRWKTKGVFLLDLTEDTITEVSVRLNNQSPSGIAALQGFILFGYLSIPKLGIAVLGATPETSSWTVSDMKTPRCIAVDPGGRFLVADPDSNRVYVLSVTGSVKLQLLAEVESNSPYDITLSSDNRRLYVGNHYTGEITVFE